MLEQTNAALSADKTELNPYVTSLANQLIDVARSAELKFDSTGWELITEVLSYAASAEQRLSEQQERIDQLEKVSLTDDLTGIYNRRGLKRALGQLLSLSARYRENGVFGFLDLNGLKDINDTYGHDAGDAALRHFARLLKKRLRPSDTIARISGDEFAVLLPRCELAEGESRLRLLQENAESLPLTFDDVTIPVRFALGLSVIRPGADPNAVIRAADAAMYQDKQNIKATAKA